MTRNEIISNMCLTFNHAYFLPSKDEDDLSVFNAAITKKEKDALWREMARLFDNNIMPYMRFRDEFDVDKSDNYK